MPQQGPLRWLDGEGWLILLGGGDVSRGVTDQVDVQILSLMNLDRPMLVLLSDGSKGDAEDILEHFVDLGGPGGEAFTLQTLRREHLRAPRLLTLIDEVGMIYLGGEDPLPLVTMLHNTPTLEHILQGYTSLQGLIIVGAGGGAAAIGGWIVPPHAAPVRGLGFVMDTIVAPHFTRTEDVPALRHFPEAQRFALGLGIPDGTALALGPAGQVEMWGEGQVTAVIRADKDQELSDETA